MLLRLKPQTPSPVMETLDRALGVLGYETARVTVDGGLAMTVLPIAEELPLSQGELHNYLKSRAPEAAAHVTAIEKTTACHLTQRAQRPEGTRVRAGDVEIGGDSVAIIAGPCSVESREQILETAQAVRRAGANLLRGGAYKPRTSTYSFQGLGLKGLQLLAEARALTGLGIVTEVLDSEDVEIVADYADMLQVGARNMQNFGLLKKLGRLRKPVLLKRGAGATLEEWLSSAEYLLARGNPHVVLCERGIRTFEGYTRNTLDISAVPAMHELTHLPVLVDPSHATGKRSLIAATTRAAVASGADGICLEVHIRPEESISDREQALSPAQFADIMQSIEPVAAAVGRSMTRQAIAAAC